MDGKEVELTNKEFELLRCLLEHRGALGPLLAWLSRSPIADVAIGTDDLKSLYEQYHRARPNDPEGPLAGLI